MSWGRLDDDMRDHPKWLALSPLAYRLGVRLVLWARKHSPSGFVPEYVVKEFAGTRTMARKLAVELVTCGRHFSGHGILEVCESGYVIHDFDAYGDRSRLVTQAPPAAQAPPVAARTTKADAGRIGGLRSAESRRSASGSAQPNQHALGASKQTLEAPRSTAEAPGESASKHRRSTAEAASDPSFQNNSGFPDPDPEPDHILLPKDLTGSAPAPASEGEEEEQQEHESGVHAMRPTNLESALRMPIQDRARYAVDRPDVAGWLVPQRWPEVGQVFEAFGDAWERQLGSPGHYDRDSATRAAVALLAAFPLDVIQQGAKLSLQNPLIRNGNRALAAISPEVLRRTLSGDFGGPRRTGPVQPDNGYDVWAGREVAR